MYKKIIEVDFISRSYYLLYLLNTTRVNISFEVVCESINLISTEENGLLYDRSTKETYDLIGFSRGH